tara:strand:+ start:241 stop:1425 length:1185 start_codon:yes stop_codon:yes gene_type:complete
MYLKNYIKYLSKYPYKKKFKRKVLLILTRIAGIIRRSLNVSNERAIYIFLQLLRSASLTNNDSKLLTEFRIYPKYPKRIFPIESNIKNLSIIIQGPILNKEFVQESINWYRSCGVNQIIISTNNEVDDFKNAKTIICDKSNIIGLGNENNHITTTINALNHIEDERLVLKTRSDQRIYNELAISAIPFIHDSYNSNLTKDGKRIGVISNNSMLLKINNISDHLYIGNAIQLKRMFSLPFRDRKETFNNISLDKSYFEKREDGTWLLISTKDTCRFTEFFGEQLLFNSFRKNCLKENLSENSILSPSEYIDGLKRYLNVIKNCIYVIDPEELDLYWIKSNIYTLPSFYHNKFQNDNPIPCMRLTRLNWLSLLSDLDYEDKIIKYADSLEKNTSLF